MRIGTFLSGTGSNMGSWRHPESVPDGAVNLGHYLEMTRQAADGFMLDCPVLPAGMTEFINEVVPILVERGLFRDEYEAETLRGNLGLVAFDPGAR